MAEALIKYETIDETQIKDIMEGRDPKPPADWDDTADEPLGRHARRAIAKKPKRRSASRPASTDRHWFGDSMRSSKQRPRTAALPSAPMQLRCGRHTLDLTPPVVMGVLNVTPDSFSDGGRFARRCDARRARASA